MHVAGLTRLHSHQISSYVGDVARWWVKTSPADWLFDSRIQRLGVLSDVHIQTNFRKYWLALFYLWTYKQRQSGRLPVGEACGDLLNRNTYREDPDIGKPPWTETCFLEGPRMSSETMALDHTSCDQEVAPSPLNSEVSMCMRPLLVIFRWIHRKAARRMQRIFLDFYHLVLLKWLFWLR